MYYFIWGINSLVVLMLAYLLLFNPDYLATGINQRATGLASIALVGVLILTGLSIYFKLIHPVSGIPGSLLILSWLFLLACFYVFFSRQKWM